jgi:hypothetical protein
MSVSEVRQRRHPGLEPSGESQGAALAVGGRPQRGETPTRMPRRLGVWPDGLFSPAFLGENQSVGHGLHEEGHSSPGSIQGFDARRIEKNPRQVNRDYAWGFAWGSMLAFMIEYKACSFVQSIEIRWI